MTETPKGNRQKFVDLASARVSKALHAIRNVRRLANRRAYEFTEPDVKEIFKALESEMKAAYDSFQLALKGKSAPATTEFTLKA